MWSRIANTGSNSITCRSLLQQHSKRPILPCIFDHVGPTDRVNILCSLPLQASSHSNPTSMIRRQKHSQTQIKRLFKDHPARLRIEKRIWNIDRARPRVIFPEESPTTSSAPTADATFTNTMDEQQSQETNIVAARMDGSPVEQPTPQLAYPPIYTIPMILPNGWFPPMDPKLRPEYPFSIRRTKNKPKDAIGFLPIYTKYRYVIRYRAVLYCSWNDLLRRNPSPAESFHFVSVCRKDGTKVVTRIKNISGDIEKFVRELRIVLSIPQPANQLQSYDAIRLRAGNLIEIQGHRAGEIRSWLGQLGF